MLAISGFQSTAPAARRGEKWIKHEVVIMVVIINA
jgi:hypothetical protein